MCDKEFIWNPSNCECECDISCDIGEYLDYKNFKCKKKILDKLTEQCIENINGHEMLYDEITLNEMILFHQVKIKHLILVLYIYYCFLCF